MKSSMLKRIAVAGVVLGAAVPLWSGSAGATSSCPYVSPPNSDAWFLQTGSGGRIDRLDLNGDHLICVRHIPNGDLIFRDNVV